MHHWEFSRCESLAAVIAEAKARHEVWKTRPGLESESLACRFAGLARALEAFSQARSLGDRGVLLREAIRLCDDHLTLPTEGMGLGGSEQEVFGRFGLSIHRQAGTISLGLLQLPDTQEVPEELASSLREVLRLDPGLRRFHQPDVADGVLSRLSEHSEYRNPTQKSAMRELVTMPPGATLLASIPTGGGKSLLFQLGVQWWRERATGDKPCAVVVVPTVALALAHAKTLREIHGLEGSAALVGTLSSDARKELLLRFRRGEVPLLLLSPEMAMQAAHEALLLAARPQAERSSDELGHLEGFFVDEAHIIESWGRTFRPDFQRLPALLRELRARNRDLRAFLLSATVGPDARLLLERQYGDKGPFLTVTAGCPRSELDLVVHRFDQGTARDSALLHLMDFLPRPAIIYTTRPKDADSLADRLRQGKYERLAVFTGDTAGDARDDIVHRWRVGALDLVVATAAFGMGIDKGDVRTVVHACMPEDGARYYQEIGRAGRDGHQALGLILWTPHDAENARGMASGQLMRNENAERRWWALVHDARERQAISHEHETGRPIMTVRLDLAPPGRGEGSYNRIWNASLLNQLQRYQAAEVLSVDNDRDQWTLALWNAHLLDKGAESRCQLLEALEGRPKEVQSALAGVQRFQEALETADTSCLLCKVFELVESDPPLIEHCGRCPYCRRRRLPPPTSFEFRGLSNIWPDSQSSARSGCHHIHPEHANFSSPKQLVTRLVGAGVEQLIVPKGKGPEFALLMKTFCKNPGLILECGHLAPPHGWRPARRATALLLRDNSQDELLNALALRKTRDEEKLDEVGLFVVAPPGLRIEGRSAEQVISNHAPIAEALLDGWKAETK